MRRILIIADTKEQLDQVNDIIVLTSNEYTIRVIKTSGFGYGYEITTEETTVYTFTVNSFREEYFRGMTLEEIVHVGNSSNNEWNKLMPQLEMYRR